MMVNSVRNKYVKNTPKKIYISRRTWIHNDYSNIGTNYTTKRKLKNEDELVEYLCKKGYTEVFTENMSTIDKILLFSNASHVIGAIGGGIANVLFSNENTELIALVSPTFLDINKRFIYSLNKVRMTIFDDTCHYESDKYKKYMRVKYNNIIGEIDEINGDNLIISYTDGSNTGWNNQYKYDNITINKNDVILLDNGLNSEWIVNNIENII
jgi:capsular polysaccharide biosynthesis protein